MTSGALSLIRLLSPLLLASLALPACTKKDKAVSEPLAERSPDAGLPTTKELLVESSAPEPIGNCSLGTTIQRPEGRRAKALVVILHGSGPIDRDLNLPTGHHPYKDIAVHLALHGYASARFDKRAFIKECAQRLGETLTVDVFLNDVLQVTKAARQFDDLASIPLVLLGHSEGVTYANEITARKLLDPKGLILVAGLGRYPIDATFLRQLKASKERPDAGPAQRAQLEKILDEGSDFFARVRTGEAKPDEFFVGAFTRFWAQTIDLTDRAALTAASTTQPALVLIGDQDKNVTKDDFDALKAAFRGRRHSDGAVIGGMGHLMTPEDSTVTSPELLGWIVTWLDRLTAPGEWK